RLETQPAPRELRHDPADPVVAGLADALFVVALTTLVGGRRQPCQCAHLAAIRKSPPAEELVHKDGSRGLAYAFESHQCPDLVHGASLIVAVLLGLLALQGFDLAGKQFHSLELMR